jgi:hypothetical protein
MNAVEIEASVSDLAFQRFDAIDFPFSLLWRTATRTPRPSACGLEHQNKTDVGAVLGRDCSARLEVLGLERLAKNEPCFLLKFLDYDAVLLASGQLSAALRRLYEFISLKRSTR